MHGVMSKVIKGRVKSAVMTRASRHEKVCSDLADAEKGAAKQSAARQ